MTLIMSPSLILRLLILKVIDKDERTGGRIIQFSNEFTSWMEMEKLLDLCGEVPLPPYIDKDKSSGHEESYQTRFASKPGAIAAPTAGLHLSDELIEILKIKKNLRILKLSKDALQTKNQNSNKSIMGGLLVQENDDGEDKTESWISVTKKKPSNQMNLDLNFAWKICKHVKSNAIVIAKDQKTIGIGAGQMNRVGAAKIALTAAKESCSEAVLASDGFFPFADTVELANEYGIKAIIQPGGSLRDQESIDMCDSKGISMVFTQKRHFLH